MVAWQGSDGNNPLTLPFYSPQLRSMDSVRGKEQGGDTAVRLQIIHYSARKRIRRTSAGTSDQSNRHFQTAYILHTHTLFSLCPAWLIRRPNFTEGRHLHLTWRWKQIQLPKRCVFKKTVDDGQSPNTFLPSAIHHHQNTLELMCSAVRWQNITWVVNRLHFGACRLQEWIASGFFFSDRDLSLLKQFPKYGQFAAPSVLRCLMEVLIKVFNKNVHRHSFQIN
jgi:hypothetical protein